VSPETQPSFWIWQSATWPKLRFDWETLAPGLARARFQQGRLLGLAEAIGSAELSLVQGDIWSGEAVATAAIEGEELDLKTVRSSVARRLGIARDPTAPVREDVEGLLDIMEDAAGNWDSELSEERLFRWQGALFPRGYSSLRSLATGRYRIHDEPMQIVSGPVDRETVHYEAPPSNVVPVEMRKFLDWFNASRNTSEGNGIARAGIAHVWFESIHPFEDGNGRVGRAIVDMALAQEAQFPYRLHGVSMELQRQQSAYYDALNAAQRGDGDITNWLRWFIDTFVTASQMSVRLIDESLIRARFWSEHRGVAVNARQRKVLDKLLEAGPGRFEGGMTPRKYVSLTHASAVTASRDLAELVAHGLLVRAGSGRSTRYDLAIDGWGWAPRKSHRRAPRSGDVR
jgi:Fic family protein